MYRDDPRINIIGVEDDKDAENFIKISNMGGYRLGFAVGGQKIANCLWDRNFYLNGTNIPMETLDRDLFYYRRDYTSEYKTYKYFVNNNEPYAFIHSASSLGIDGIDYSKITPNIKTIYTVPSVDFFNYGLIIQNASEIHCVNSSFKHLVERIPTSGKLFYHKNKHLLPYSDMTTTKIWEEV
jgi:hypothetical protein